LGTLLVFKIFWWIYSFSPN